MALLRTGLMILALIAVSGCAVAEEGSDTIAGVRVAPGERVDVSFDVPAGETDAATFIPVTILRGAADGPTALMVAGVHGYAFAPMLAADRLAESLSLETMTGNFIIVRVAHIPAFEDRSVFVNPNDRKNLNRSFPGKVDGTQTERIAHVLSTELIASADFVFDVHSGDGAEWLEPFVGAWGGPLATDYPTALAAAKAIGFPNVVRYAMFTQEQIDNGRSLNRQAVAQGLPTILIEIGQNGSRDEAHVQRLVDGIKNALASLGVLQNKVSTFPQPRTFESSKAVKAGHSGFWYPTRRGGPVMQGEVIGEIRNYRGQVVEVLRSPIDGYGIYGQMGPPIR